MGPLFPDNIPESEYKWGLKVLGWKGHGKGETQPNIAISYSPDKSYRDFKIPGLVLLIKRIEKEVKVDLRDLEGS